MAERKTVAFYGTCAALGELTLVSARIGHNAVLRRIRASFALGCINLMALRFYFAVDDDAPAAGEPSGVSVLRDYGQVDYVVGEGEIVDIQHGVSIRERPFWMKVYAVNGDFFDHAVNVQLELEIAD